MVSIIKNDTSITFRLSLDDKNKLVQFCEEHDLNMGQVLRKALIEYLANEQRRAIIPYEEPNNILTQSDGIVGERRLCSDFIDAEPKVCQISMLDI